MTLDSVLTGIVTGVVASIIIIEAKYPVFPGFFSRSVGIMQN